MKWILNLIIPLSSGCVCVWGGATYVTEQGGLVGNDSNNQIHMLSSKKIVSDSIMMSSQMMLSSACMAYLNDKLIGFKPNKDNAALCDRVAIFTHKTQNIRKHEGLYTKTNCIPAMNFVL